MTFLVNPLGFSPAEFKTYVESLKWNKGWRPQLLVLHNTAEPNLAQWVHFGLGKTNGERRVRNLNQYYQSDEGWHSGPHIFVAPDLIWVACDLAADGVHASCYNSESIGVEMVGDYSVEDFASGDGVKVRDNAVAALAILHHALGISPDTLRFHKECIRDHHDCPGKNVDKADIVARVKAWLPLGGGLSGGADASGDFRPEPATPALAQHVEAVGAASSASRSGVRQPLDENVAAPASYNDKAATIYQFWLANGFTSAQACGLLAQADAESSLDPEAEGDHGQAFGLGQWHASRVDAIRNGCGVDLAKLPSLADQLRAALWELQHTEKHALTQIKATRTAYDAGYAACRFWERPASTAQYGKRGALAEKWAVFFSKNPV